MKTISLLSMTVLLQVFACCQSNNHVTLLPGMESIDIHPDKAKMEDALASKYIDSCQYIPLESADSIMIGYIQQIFEDKDRFYIHDSASDIVFIYDKNGHFISKIDRKGRGNNEYIKIAAMHVDPENSDIIILCDRSQSLIRYDRDGKFIGRTEHKFITSAFATINSDTLIAYGGRLPNETIFSSTFPEGYLLVTMHDGKVTHNFLKNRFDAVYLNYTGKTNYFFNFSDTLSLIEDFSNTIYRITPSGVKPRYAVTFGKYTLPMTFHTPIEQAKEIITTFQASPSQWCDVRQVIENKNIILIHYSFENLIQHAIYLKPQKQTRTIGPIWVNDIDGIGMPTICNSSPDNAFIGFIEAHTFIDLVKNTKKSTPRVTKISQGLTEMDNPILVKVFLKQEIK